MYILFCLQTAPIDLKVISQVLVEVQTFIRWNETLVLLVRQPDGIDLMSSLMLLLLTLVLVKIIHLYLPNHF